MPFDLYVIRTVNGTPKTIRWCGFAESERANVEQIIADFEAGVMPIERTLTVGPIRERSWRWGDIRDIWIEEV